MSASARFCTAEQLRVSHRVRFVGDTSYRVYRGRGLFPHAYAAVHRARQLEQTVPFEFASQPLELDTRGRFHRQTNTEGTTVLAVATPNHTD